MRDRRIRRLALVAAACSIVALGAVPAAAGAPDNDVESAAVKRSHSRCACRFDKCSPGISANSD